METILQMETVLSHQFLMQQQRTMLMRNTPECNSPKTEITATISSYSTKQPKK